MPKVKISEYSATANSNTDVASINIDEGCAPSGINNAIRAVMGHLKDFQQGTNGDPFNGPMNGTLGATTASTAVVTTLNSTDATDASSTTAAAMKTAGGLGVAKKMFVGLDANIYGLTVGRGAGAVASNTAVGASALAGSNTGINNTAIGSSALALNTSGNRNAAVGSSALASNTTGVENTAVGHDVISGNTTGSYNVAFGRSAMSSNSTGSNNSAIGFAALGSNTTASNNTAVGYQAAYSNTTGTNHTAFGKGALYANTTGTENSAFGVDALNTNTTGNYNVAIGLAANKLNTTGSNNTSLGYLALLSNTTASNNTAVGYQAGYSNTTGTRNALVGYGAGQNLTTGSYNAFLGANAGAAYLTTMTGSNNTFVGDSSGVLVSSGSKNSILGCYSGNQGGLDIRTASNYIVLSDGDGNPAAYRNSANTWSFGDASNQCALGIQDNRSNVGTLTTINTNASYADYLITAQASRAATTSYGFFRGIANSVAQYYIYGNGTTAAPSDERLKKNVETARDGYLDDIAKLRVVKYNWKTQEEGEAKELGFIAQEFEQVFPRLVDELAVPVSEETPNPVAYKSIKNSVIVPMLVKAIQELKAEVDSLKAQINGASA